MHPVTSGEGRCNAPPARRAGRQSLSLRCVSIWFVVTFSPDSRFLQGSEAPDSLAVLEREAGVRLEADIRLAKALLDLERNKTAVCYGCSSVMQLARRFRLPEYDARRLLEFGKAMELEPSIEDRVRRGAMSVDAAATIAVVLPHDPVKSPAELAIEASDRLIEAWARGEDVDLSAPLPPENPDGPPVADHSFWVSQAQTKAPSRLRKAVKKRVAEIRSGEAVVEVSVHVSETVREKFEVAREIASRKARRVLGDDETFEAVVDHYVESFDEMRREGRRRVGPTGDATDDRYVPVEVRRDVRRRAGDHCEFPGCVHYRFLEFAHWTPHREGSGREVSDLILLCHLHHTMMDAGYFARLGTPEDPVFLVPGIRDWGIAVTKQAPGGRGLVSEKERRAWEEWLRRCRALEAAAEGELDST